MRLAPIGRKYRHDGRSTPSWLIQMMRAIGAVMSINVTVFVGSLRKASFTRKVANALIEVAPRNLRCRLIEIGDVAVFNEDLEGDNAS